MRTKSFLSTSYVWLVLLISMPASASAHQSIPSLDDATCLNCHKVIIQQKVSHPAVEGGCSSCHVGKNEGGKTTFTLAANGDTLCFGCHPDKQELLKKQHVHPAFKEMGCTSCHNPHGSSVAKLLTATIPELCLNCHDDKKVDEKAVTKHPPFEGGECLACHDPHASDQPKLLPKKVKEVCMECHADKVKKQHPVPYHPVDGVDDPSQEGKELSCVSCHNPHQSGFRKLFYKTGNRTQLCFDCHSKGKKAIK